MLRQCSRMGGRQSDEVLRSGEYVVSRIDADDDPDFCCVPASRFRSRCYIRHCYYRSRDREPRFSRRSLAMAGIEAMLGGPWMASQSEFGLVDHFILKRIGEELGWKKLLGPSFKDRTLTGIIKVDKVAGKSAATRAFAKYPLKFLIPSKIVSSGVDAVWIYAISYGGGIVSNDSITQRVDVSPSCSAVITTQASTKIYKSVKGKFCEQILQAHVGREGFLAVLPDPITCFKDSKYIQVQEFHLATESNLVLIDWMTSGRIDNGESWEFGLYKSTNHIYLEDEEAGQSTPLFLDCLCLEQGVGISVAERMQGFHVIANMVIYGPKLATFRAKIQKNVQALTQKAFTRRKSADFTAHLRDSRSSSTEPLFFVSCSTIGLRDEGLVVRAVASTTEVVYDFFRQQLAHIASEIGACPYASR